MVFRTLIEKSMFIIAFGVCIVFMGKALAQKDDACPPDCRAIYNRFIVNQIRDNKEHFTRKIEREPSGGGNDSTILSVITTEGNDSSLEGNLFHLIGSRHLLSTLIGFDKCRHQSIFIEDTVVSKILVKALEITADDNTSDENELLLSIVNLCRPQLHLYSLFIKKALVGRMGKGRNRKSCILLYSLVADSTEKQKLLKGGDDFSMFEKAILGHEPSADSLITGYLEAESFKDIKRTSEKIKYLTGEADVTAKKMLTKFCDDRVYRGYTTRYYICEALGFLFPQDTVLRNMREILHGERGYGLRRVMSQMNEKERLNTNVMLLRNRDKVPQIPDSLIDYFEIERKYNHIKKTYGNGKIACDVQKPYFKGDRRLYSHHYKKDATSSHKEKERIKVFESSDRLESVDYKKHLESSRLPKPKKSNK